MKSIISHLLTQNFPFIKIYISCNTMNQKFIIFKYLPFSKNTFSIHSPPIPPPKKLLHKSSFLPLMYIYSYNFPNYAFNYILRLVERRKFHPIKFNRVCYSTFCFIQIHPGWCVKKENHCFLRSAHSL